MAIPACQLLPAPHEGGVMGGDRPEQMLEAQTSLGTLLACTQEICWLAALETGRSPVPSPQSQSQAQELSWGKTAPR